MPLLWAKGLTPTEPPPSSVGAQLASTPEASWSRARAGGSVLEAQHTPASSHSTAAPLLASFLPG